MIHPVLSRILMLDHIADERFLRASTPLDQRLGHRRNDLHLCPA